MSKKVIGGDYFQLSNEGYSKHKNIKVHCYDDLQSQRLTHEIPNGVEKGQSFEQNNLPIILDSPTLNSNNNVNLSEEVNQKQFNNKKKQSLRHLTRSSMIENKQEQINNQPIVKGILKRSLYTELRKNSGADKQLQKGQWTGDNFGNKQHLQNLQNINQILRERYNLVKRFKSVSSQVEEDLMPRVEHFNYNNPNHIRQKERSEIQFMRQRMREKTKSKQRKQHKRESSYTPNPHNYQQCQEKLVQGTGRRREKKNSRVKQCQDTYYPEFVEQNMTTINYDKDISPKNQMRPQRIKIRSNLDRNRHEEQERQKFNNINTIIFHQIDMLGNRLNNLEEELAASEQRMIKYQLQRELVDKDRQLKKLQLENQILKQKNNSKTEVQTNNKEEDKVMKFIQAKFPFLVSFFAVMFLCILLTKSEGSCRR